MTDRSHKDLTHTADIAFRAWFNNPADRDLERNYWDACDAVRRSSIGIFKQSLGLPEDHNDIPIDKPR